MDLPTYKMPLFGYDFKLVLGKVWEFISGAGKVIFTVSIILWALSYFGPPQHKNEILATNSSLTILILEESEERWNQQLHHSVTTGKWESES
jgi:Fe2+ transport system protein B